MEASFAVAAVMMRPEALGSTDWEVSLLSVMTLERAAVCLGFVRVSTALFPFRLRDSKSFRSRAFSGSLTSTLGGILDVKYGDLGSDA